MLKKTFLAEALVSLTLVYAVANVMGAASPAGVALTGQATSQEEALMEGVLVSAKREGSTITTTVVTNAQGRYSFPSAKLEPGHYTLSIRAVGYELDSSQDFHRTLRRTSHRTLTKWWSATLAARQSVPT